MKNMIGLVLSLLLARVDPVEWDQERAKAFVRSVLAVEAKGQPWDRIKWSKDEDEVIESARRQNLPILVFWYVAKQGPSLVPC